MKHRAAKEMIHISNERLADIVRAPLLNPDAVGEEMTSETHCLFRGLILG